MDFDDDELMLHPSEVFDDWRCVEMYQWAIQHWFHSSCAVLEEMSGRDNKVYFCAMIEYCTGRDIKTKRVYLTERELAGMYMYWKMIHKNSSNT